MNIRGNTIGTTISADRVLAKAGGVKSYYSTNREEVEVSHENLNTDYIFGLYDAMMEEHPGKVQKKEHTSNDGTFTNYEYVISTGDYSTEGTLIQSFGESQVEKPKHLVLSGIHGDERVSTLSAYRFIRDVLSGHNVPQAFREGVIISVMPVGNPSAFDSFIRGSVDINRDFNSDSPVRETQAIKNWLASNADAELFIDCHNGGKLNEKVAVLAPSNSDTTTKIAMRGVDRIIPHWRDVIGYPDGTIYSYAASIDTVAGSAVMYAQENLGISGCAIETAVYYGSQAEWEANKKVYSAEAIAMGAETLGNILMEFYNQSCEVMMMGKISDTLDTLLEQVNSGFHMESGTVEITDANIGEYFSSNKLMIPCSSGAKTVVFQADMDTVTAIKADATTHWTLGLVANCFGPVGDITSSFYTNRGYVCRLAPNSQGKYVPSEVGCGGNNTDGFTVSLAALKVGTYNWTAYYWNE